jgi:hypothetical protein
MSSRHTARRPPNIATLRPPQLLQPLLERSQRCLHFRVALAKREQHADARPLGEIRRIL